MKRLAVIAALILAPGLAAADSRERFQLWNECQPIVLFGSASHDSDEIGLSAERIETVVRSRLRAARIYTDEPYGEESFLLVEVGALSSAFRIQLHFLKWVVDVATDQVGYATTWQTYGFGTHGQDAGFILQHVSEYTDQFIDEYLRVNAEAC